MGVDWIDMAQDMDQWRALVNTVMNLRVSYNAGKFLGGCTIGGSSSRAQLRKYLTNISATLKTEADNSSETSVSFHRATRRHVSQDIISQVLSQRRCDNVLHDQGLQHTSRGADE
jgi:uncharacterized protein (DUF2267 family)